LKINRPQPDEPTTIRRPFNRPRVYNRQLAEKILIKLSSGKSLTSILKEDGMPVYSTVMRWIWQESEYQEWFSNSYKIAREQQAEYMIDHMQDIADDGTNDYTESVGKDGKTYTRFDSENVQRSKLRVDARKWIAAHLRPTKYGDRVSLTGPGDQPLIPAKTTIVIDFGEGNNDKPA
jgi:hypothetical protein